MKNKLILTIILGMFLISFTSAVDYNNPTFYWKLNEETNGTDAMDSIGNYYLDNPSSVGYATGKLNNAAYISGTNIRLENSTENESMKFYTNDFTIAFWIKTSQTSKSIMGSSYNWCRDGSFCLIIYQSKLYWGTATSDISGTGTTVANGNWHRVVIKRNGTSTNQFSMYVDGSLDKVSTLNYNYSNSSRFQLGSLYSPDYNTADLWLDDVRIYNGYAWTTDDIADDYNSGNGKELGSESSPIYASSTADNSSTTYPKYYDVIKHYVEWVTNATSLSTYIFSWNNSGSWANLSTTVFSGSNWSNVTLNITAVKGSNIGWYIWANDSENKINSTAIFEYLVRNSPPTSSIGMFNETGIIYNGTPVQVNVSIGDLDGLTDISSVIATIYKNQTYGSGDLNLSKVSYVKNESNPIFNGTDFTLSDGIFVESSNVYDEGVWHQWYRTGNATGAYVLYVNSTNGREWSEKKVVSYVGMPNLWFPYVLKVNSTYYMFGVDSDDTTFGDYQIRVYNSTDGLDFGYACGDTNIVNPSSGNAFNPAVWYNDTDGSWHMLLQQGSFAPWDIYYWNSTALCSGWANQGKVITGGADPDLTFENDKFIVYYAYRPSSATNANITLAYGDHLSSLTNFGQILNVTQDWEDDCGSNPFVSDPDFVIINDENESFNHKFYLVYEGCQLGSGIAYDSLERNFEEAHFDISYYQENLTLSQVGSTSEWSGTYTNTSFIGLYNLTKVYVNDTDNALNYSSYSTISFETQEEEGLNDTSCSVYDGSYDGDFNTSYGNYIYPYTNCTSAYHLYINGSSISNGTSWIPPAGYYNVTVQRVDTENYTNTVDTQFFTITKTTSALNIIYNTTNPVTYPNQFTVGVYTAPSLQGGYTLYRNGTSISNGSTQNLPAGYYNFTAIRSDTQNYTYTYNESNFTVNKNSGSCSVYFNTTSPVTYPAYFITYTNCTSAYTLYRNGSSISNGTTINSGATAYNLSVQRTDTQNYSNTFSQSEFIISRNTENCRVLFNETSPLAYPKTFLVWGNCTSPFVLSRNGTTITNNSEQSLAISAYNFSLSRNDTVNYSIYFNETQFIIYNATVTPSGNITVTLNSPPNYLNNSLNIVNFSCSATTDSGYLINTSLWTNATGTWHRNETKSGFSYIENFTNVSYLYADNTYRLLKNISINGDLVYNYSNKVWINTGSSTIGSFFAGFVYSNGTTVNTTVVNIAQNDVGLNNLSATYSYTNPDISKPVLYIEFWLKVTSNNRLYEGFDNVTVVNKTKTTTFLKNITGYTIWNCESCNNESECSFAASNYSINYDTTLNSVSYNLTTYETSNENYLLNITSAYLPTNAKLVYNEIEYPATITTSGTTHLISKNLQIPSSSIGSNTFYFKWNVSSTVTEYSINYTQTVSPILFGICNATLTTRYLNLTFKDEATNLALNGTILSSTFTYYLGNGTENKTYTYSTSENHSSYLFCASPSTLTYNVVPSIQYKFGTEYPLRSWTTSTTYSNTTTNQTLYLLGSTTGLYVTFQVVNSADQVLSGVNVNATRDIGGATTIIAQGTTDSAGSITFWLNPDYSHTFMFSKSGYTTYTTALTPTQSSYTITLAGTSSGSSGTSSDYTRGVKLYTYPKDKELMNDTTYNFIFNVTSSYWELDSFGFNLRLSNGTIVGTDSSTTEGSGASVSYDVNNQSIIYMDYYWVVEGNYTNSSTYWLISNSENTDWSIKTLFEDADTYMDSGLFGITNFGRYLIAFLLLFLVVGIVGYKYGVVNPVFISILTFSVVFFLDVVTGLIPAVRGIEHLVTYVAGLITLLIVVWEVAR